MLGLLAVHPFAAFACLPERLAFPSRPNPFLAPRAVSSNSLLLKEEVEEEEFIEEELRPSVAIFYHKYA